MRSSVNSNVRVCMWVRSGAATLFTQLLPPVMTWLHERVTPPHTSQSPNFFVSSKNILLHEVYRIAAAYLITFYTEHERRSLNCGEVGVLIVNFVSKSLISNKLVINQFPVDGFSWLFVTPLWLDASIDLQKTTWMHVVDTLIGLSTHVQGRIIMLSSFPYGGCRVKSWPLWYFHNLRARSTIHKTNSFCFCNIKYSKILHFIIVS